MKPKLVATDGDLETVRVCIAAAVSSQELALEKGVQGLRLTDGDLALTQSSAIASFLGGNAAVPEGLRLQVEDWLEWEETALRPAAYRDSPAVLQAALERLAKAVSAGQYLVGNVVTLADVAVYSTLLPLSGGQAQLPSGVQQYLSRLGSLPAFKAGVTKALGGADASSLAGLQERTSTSDRIHAPVLPVPGQRNILITSALPYVNNVPHLGNIIGCVLSADCYARFCKSRGYNCIYVCGTDEYGTATETKALEEGLTCQEICDKYNAIHQQIYEWFDIKFDKFGRTPTWQQTEICQAIFQRIVEEGQVKEEVIEQLYSEALGKFLADRFVTGTCPKCAYEDARGDQCDKCGSLLNPTELINPKCKITQTTPVLRETQHLFLDLPKLSPELQAYIDQTSQLGGWTSNCIQTTKAWMKEGLKPRCITRDLSWGTPIPRKGYENKVFYVWFDAPIGYISITATYTEDWKAWWQNPEEVDLVQFMGKDNVPFHTIIFPATQLATRDRWTKMKRISVTEYLTYEGTKFSKSRNTGVFGNDAFDTGIPPEVFRYYLLSNRPEQSDSDFKWSDLAAKNNNELLANLGNFANRALKFAANEFDGKAPAPHASKGRQAIDELSARVAALLEQYVAALEGIKIRDAIKIAMQISGAGNKFMQDEKPWVAVKTDRELCGALISAALGLVLVLAAVIEPYMPATAEKMLNQLNLPASSAQLTDEFIAKAPRLEELVPAGHALNAPAVLFSIISKDQEVTLFNRFRGEMAPEESAAAPAKNGKKPAASGAKGAAKVPKEKVPEGDKPATANGQQRSEKAAVDGQEQPAKEKKEKKAKAPAAPKAPAAAATIAAVDLRVGVITKAWRHEGADSLYVEEIDCGEAAPRQVVSGLVKYVPLEAMQGQRVVIVANLKPANMRGVKSHAMVLAASSADGEKVEFVEPPAAAKPGERVTVAGFDGEPVAVLKREVFDPLAAGLRTSSDRVACYNGVPLSTAEGACRVKSIADGGIR